MLASAQFWPGIRCLLVPKRFTVCSVNSVREYCLESRLQKVRFVVLLESLGRFPMSQRVSWSQMSSIPPPGSHVVLVASEKYIECTINTLQFGRLLCIYGLH